MRSSEVTRPSPVVIVGGGPVGMTAATALADAGVPVVLVEATPTVQTDWRASTFHPPTLELLAELGVADQMRAEGLAVPRYQFRDRADGLVAEFDYGLLTDETPFPFRLQLNQQRLVRILADRLAARGDVPVRFGARAVALRQHQDGVTVRVETDRGTEEIEGSFVIGADGARSTVRSLIGVRFEGFTYEQRFVIASTSADLGELLPGIADVNYVADPEEWIFLLRTPESWRAVYPVPADRSVEEATDPVSIQAHLQGIAANPTGYPIDDFQIYNVHQRVATTFRADRVVLVGDAAHVNSPLGGVGLNSGIHDAFDVARRIARLVPDPAGIDAELDEFDRVRRQVAVEYVQADTKRNTERLMERDPARRAANYAELRATAADTDLARAWCRRASLLESVNRFGIGRPPAKAAAL
jgi:3-(3-hydroxy-phenyl)propionate hydroxylase